MSVSAAPLTSYGTAHAAAAPVMYSESRLGQWDTHQSPQLVWGQQQLPVAQHQEQQQRVSTTGEARPAGSASPSIRSNWMGGLMTGIPQGMAVYPPLEASAQRQVQYANPYQLQQQITPLQPWHAMMNQGAMPWFPALAQYHTYQAALQVPQGQQLEPVGQTAQQPSTTEVAVMQQAPPHLTPLQDSSVRQTPCPLPTGAAAGGDGRTVEPPTQGAVWAWTCVP